MNITFDPKVHYLGKLCLKSHEWKETGQSVRRIKANGKEGGCVQCMRLYTSECRRRNPEKKDEYQKEYRRRNPEQFKGYEKKPERKEYLRQYRQEHKEKYKGYVKKYREKNREKLRTRRLQLYKLNSEKRRLSAKLYKERYPERVVESQKKYHQSEIGREKCKRNMRVRRIRKKGNVAYPYSKSDVAKRFEGSCAYCNCKEEKMTLDHFLPVSLGGSDCLSNVLLACFKCNHSKNNRDPKEWYQQQNFYSAKRWKEILKALGKTEATYNQLPLF